ncbi:hypothetical protein [Komagataeibacter medellinensis]|uniref:Uncharacterized protein n=1 Tax=Komagataeibacter medellinensis (strain NBRC 3288 / BCRC 11682 / LMG 1693 / Kondo 51) TaxID=634177 RepID=G2I114_KOMMN|nr:hypothetical protein [Komagataeibacter medellinensis]BAK84622.1 hypothetical protein GLX_22100 [Komagataeibacter medellinensis NBRC 3288]
MMSEVSARRLVMVSAVVALGALGGCMSMPHPFRPTGAGSAAQAPTARLAVPVSTASGTDAQATQIWQHAMVEALLAQSVPAMGQPVRPGDWWLKMTTAARNGAVVPTYAVITPKGEERGHMEGAPVPAAQWQAADGQAVARSAQGAAPGVAELLTGIQAAQMQKDPNSLKNRPAHVYFAGVHGAPGDGDHALAQAFIAAFPDAHEDIRHTATGADYTVRCSVVLNDAVTTTSLNPQQHIVLTWQVVDAQGKEAGAATQIHDIAAHSLDKKWGEVAVTAADEAAGAARQIITRYSGRANLPLAADGTLGAQPVATPSQAAPARFVASQSARATSVESRQVVAGATMPTATLPVASTPVVPAAGASVPSAPVLPAAVKAPVASSTPVIAPRAAVAPEMIAKPVVSPAAPVAPAAAPVPMVASTPAVAPASRTRLATARPAVPAARQADGWPPMPSATVVSTPETNAAAPQEIHGTPMPATPPVATRPFPGVTLPPRRGPV